MERKALATTGDRLLLLVVVLFIGLMLIIPLFTVLYNGLRDGINVYWAVINTENVWAALKLSLATMGVAVLVTTLFAIVASWAFGMFNFRGKSFLTTVIDIPFSISPVIVGLGFIMAFGRLGWATPFIETLNNWLGTDIKIVFALPGVFLVTIFVTFPFVFREVMGILHHEGCEEEQMAALMGASSFKIFRKITLPRIKWALFYGVVLCSARAIGEFGAISAISKARGSTFTLPLEIDALYMDGTSLGITAAFAVASLLVIISLVLLGLRIYLERREHLASSKFKY